LEETAENFGRKVTGVLVHSLQDELLAIPGIAGAAFDGDVAHPLGVRVQLAVGADPDTVGREVQRVLAAHGMRSQMADDDVPAPAPAQASVVNLSDYESEPNVSTQPVSATEPAPPAPYVPVGDLAGEAEFELMEGPPPAVGLPQVTVDHAEPAPAPDGAAPPVAAAVKIAGVAVDEDGSRVQIHVRLTNGLSASRSVPASLYALDEAAALAAAELASPDAVPRVVAVTDGTIGGSPVVTVVLEIAGGRRQAGASVVHGSRAYAVARASWAALQA